MAINKYHLGTTVWSLKQWKGVLFTKDAPAHQFLKQYARVFNSVEGNTTFYGMPQEQTIKNWKQQIPDNFKFCFKFPQLITHHKQLADVDGDVTTFLSLMEPLRENMGPFLIQFPAHFGPSQLPLLEQFLELLPVDFRYAVEVRHPNFFNQGPHEKHLNQALSSFGIDRVLFDTRKLHASKSKETSIAEARQRKPKLPVRFTTTGNHPVVRFVGINEPINNEPYLKEWAIVVAEWIKEGKHPYFFTHAPDPFYGIHNARTFHRKLASLITINAMPEWPAEKENKQLGLF